MSNSIELFGPINLWCSEIRHCCWFFLEGRMRLDYLFFETKQEGLIQMNTNTHLNAGARGAGRISRYLPHRIPLDLSRSTNSLRFWRHLCLFDTSSVVRLRSPPWILPDLVLRGLFLNAHHPGSLPAQLKVVWSLQLHSGFEGPTLISCAAPHFGV